MKEFYLLLLFAVIINFKQDKRNKELYNKVDKKIRV